MLAPTFYSIFLNLGLKCNNFFEEMGNTVRPYKKPDDFSSGFLYIIYSSISVTLIVKNGVISYVSSPSTSYSTIYKYSSSI